MYYTWRDYIRWAIVIGIILAIIGTVYIETTNPCIAIKPYDLEPDGAMTVNPDGIIGYRINIKGLRERTGEDCWVKGVVSPKDYERVVQDQQEK